MHVMFSQAPYSPVEQLLAQAGFDANFMDARAHIQPLPEIIGKACSVQSESSPPCSDFWGAEKNRSLARQDGRWSKDERGCGREEARGGEI